jgi:hypothetical protein
LLITTPDNQLVRILLEGGEIVSLIFGAKQGMEVVPLIAGIKSARVRFSAGKAGSMARAAGLSSTVALLKMLAGNLAAAPEAKASVRPGRAGAKNPLKVVEEELVEVLGPLGTLVLQENAAQAGDPTQPGVLRRLIDASASHIRDPEKARRFRQQVEARLRG